ncbi:MAG: hypothetical protein ACK4VU_12420 [Limnohabitans sp.]
MPLIDPRTGLIDRAWYMFFLSLLNAATLVDDGDLGPSAESLIASYDEALRTVNQELQALPSSKAGELQAQINEVRQALEVLPRAELGTMAPLQQANLPWVTFDTTPEHVPTDIGTVAWDGGTTLGIQMTANVLQQVGETQYYYIKADSTITKGQLIMFTGAVGASGVIKGAPATGLTDGQYLMGVAAENIAANGFGLVTSFGHVRGWNTTGTPVGEVWADGDILYYNPTIAGGLTKTQPTAPNVKATIAVVVNAAPAGSGDVFVRVSTGSVLGGTDSNVQFGTLANGNIIQYDSALGYWKNVTLSAAGLVTSVTGTSPVVSSGGSTPAISLASGYGDTQNPYAAKTANFVLAGPTTGAAALPTFRALVAADIPALPYGTGTVTSVSVVSANGFAGTVATATTTPAITLTTTITGLLKGNGTAISAAVVNTDYFAPSAPVTKTADFTVAATEVWLINNKSGSTCTATLPAAASWSGRVLRFQNYQVQALVSASSNVVPLAGGAATTSILLASSGDSATLVSDGTNWLMTQYIPNNILLLE